MYEETTMRRKKRNRSRHLWLLLFFSITAANLSAQSAIDITAGSEIKNSIIFNNRNAEALLGEGIIVNHTAIDSVVAGENNLLLEVSPFSQEGWKSNEAAEIMFRNAGKTQVLGDEDTLDLSNNPRTRYEQVDIGPYQFPEEEEEEEEPIVDTFYILAEFDVGCKAGEASAWFQAFGTTGPFTYTWMYAGGEFSTGIYEVGQSPGYIGKLYPGEYIITVTDTNNEVRTQTVVIPPANEIVVSYILDNPTNSDCDGGKITFTIAGGAPIPEIGYNWSWNDGTIGTGGSGERWNIHAGWHNITVTDFRNCVHTEEIALQCLYRRVMPTMFISPNDDGMNDYLYILNIEHYPNNRVTIVDSRGNQINTFTRYNNNEVRWDGRDNRGRAVPDGTYYYIVEADGISAMAGWVLVRDSR
jgi:gliding motility-associated-like protein